MIKNVIIKLSKEKLVDYIIIVVIGCIVGVLLNKVKLIFGTHDGLIHFARIKGTMNAIQIHEFPALIDPESCMGFCHTNWSFMFYYIYMD